MQDLRLIYRIPNDNRGRRMSVRHLSISKCTDMEKPEGNSIWKHFTMVIHRRCYMGRSEMRKEIG